MTDPDDSCSWPNGDGPPPARSAYVDVEDPDALCGEYTRAGAAIVAVALRPFVAGRDGTSPSAAPDVPM